MSDKLEQFYNLNENEINQHPDTTLELILEAASEAFDADKGVDEAMSFVERLHQLNKICKS